MSQRVFSLALALWTLAMPGGSASAQRSAADAERSPEENLRRAVILYEELQLERAVTLLREVASPSAATSTAAQRVEAYKYLGAALTLLGQRDSAVTYHRMALERDPFVDLSASAFTPQERAVFAEAKRRTFAVGVRPMSDTALAPGHGGVALRFVTTHRAKARVTIHLVGAPETPVASFEWMGEGVHDLSWDGLSADGRRLEPGRYAMRIVATADSGNAGSADALFDVRYESEALEDTLPALDGAALLPERRSPAHARSHLGKSLALALASAAIPAIIGSRELGGSGNQGAAMAVVAGATGVGGFVLMHRQTPIRANVRENARRQQERSLRNIEIRRRNEERMARARTLISPVAVETR